MYIRSRYMDAVEEIQAELMRIAEELEKTTKALAADEIFTGDWTDNDYALAADEIFTGDWTDNDCAIAHDDLRQDLEEMKREIDTTIADLASIIAREKVRT